MDTSALSGGGVAASIMLVLFGLYKAVNHHRVRSNCCGRKMEASFDVEKTLLEDK